MAAATKHMDTGWRVRVGVHSGPVVAGIVGEEKYQFDVWGDTVNMAARMGAYILSLTGRFAGCRGPVLYQ